MSKILPRKFYQQTTLKVAQHLLGKFLIYKKGTKKFSGMIVETEAYCGRKDLACHSAKGKTPRTEVMFGEAGHAYVYLIYGMYHCLNIVTRGVDQPEAVLIRAVEPYAGPGKLCREIGITKRENGLDVTKSEILWIEDRGAKVTPAKIKKATRIGVNYADEYAFKNWRFYLKDNLFVSKR